MTDRVSSRLYENALRRARREGARLDRIAPLLIKAHEAGDPRATYALASWYLHGRGVAKDVRLAVKLLREAATCSMPDALYDLAVCYEKGTSVRKNPRKAVELYLRAALLGEKQSVYEVGRCYYYGLGVKEDRNVARVWLDRAKELGIVH